MAKKVSGSDLSWILREALSVRFAGFKDVPIAIVPASDGWQAITSARYRNNQSLLKHLAKISRDLQSQYKLLA